MQLHHAQKGCNPPEISHDGACSLGAVISFVVKVLSIKLPWLVPIQADVVTKRHTSETGWQQLGATEHVAMLT